MGEVKLQRVMLPHLRPLTKTRTNIRRYGFCLFFFFIFVWDFYPYATYLLSFHYFMYYWRSLPTNYFKQSSRNTLKLKKSSIKWTTFRCHFLNNGPPRFINIWHYMVWMDTHNTKGTPHKCSLPWHWLLVTWLMHVIYVRVWAVHRKELEYIPYFLFAPSSQDLMCIY